MFVDLVQDFRNMLDTFVQSILYHGLNIDLDPFGEHLTNILMALTLAIPVALVVFFVRFILGVLHNDN